LLNCTLRPYASIEWYEVEKNQYVPRNVTYHHEDHAFGLLRRTTIRRVRLFTAILCKYNRLQRSTC